MVCALFGGCFKLAGALNHSVFIKTLGTFPFSELGISWLVTNMKLFSLFSEKLLLGLLFAVF